MNIINCTPHAITVIGDDNATMTIPVSGTIARLATAIKRTHSITVGDTVFAVTKTVFGDVTNLPDPVEGTIFVVSRLVLDASPMRLDLVAPGELVRGADGSVVGCRGFSV